MKYQTVNAFALIRNHDVRLNDWVYFCCCCCCCYCLCLFDRFSFPSRNWKICVECEQVHIERSQFNSHVRDRSLFSSRSSIYRGKKRRNDERKIKEENLHFMVYIWRILCGRMRKTESNELKIQCLLAIWKLSFSEKYTHK